MNLQNKKVLVTGAGGFIGNFLVNQLIQRGCNVKAFIHYNSKNSYGWLDQSPYKNDIEFYTGDIRDYDSVYNACKNVDVVFHLAALIGIPYSYISPLAYIKTNVEGTYNILESAKQLDIERVIITSTSEVYGSALEIPINEDHKLQPQSPYSATKIGADNLTLSYYNSFNLPITIARPFNTYGPRQSTRAIIPTIITQILNGNYNLKLGNLLPTRDFNYVSDTVNGFIKIAECDYFKGEVVNIGSGREISIEDLIEIISQIMKVDVKIDEDKKRVRNINTEVQQLLCDNTKIKTYTDWKSEVDLETGLQLTIDWFKENLHLYKDGYTI
jgi:NAD dependent epimerase/dehydratase